MITGTELAAYVAPAVPVVSAQTPAFGSLPGSQGGEFVFQVPSGEEFLTAETAQLSADAIALNGRVDAARPAPATAGAAATAAPVTVKTLQGGEATLVVPTAVNSSDRQRAQLANERGLQLYKESATPTQPSNLPKRSSCVRILHWRPITLVLCISARGAPPNRRAGWKLP